MSLSGNGQQRCYGQVQPAAALKVMAAPIHSVRFRELGRGVVASKGYRRTAVGVEWFE